MSADNYYRIFKKDSLYYPVMAFMSDDSPPTLTDRRRTRGGFGSLQDAYEWADAQYSEYGVIIDQSAMEFEEEK